MPGKSNRQEGRSYKPISREDLARLASIAREDREDLFRRKPALARIYQGSVLCVALCQGAALHYLNGTNGVKDFDVWTFFREDATQPFPYRRNKGRDFGDPKFGTTPGEHRFVGRRVDLLGRSIPVKTGQPPIEALRHYLSTSGNDTPRRLAEKALVILEPASLMGVVAWPEPKT